MQKININGIEVSQEDYDKYKQLTENEYNKLKLEHANNTIGNLPYYDCDICKNKGYVYYYSFDDTFKKIVMKAKDCKCKTIRNIYNNLEKCGVSKETFDRYSFDSFETNEQWQQKLKEMSIKYVDGIKNNELGFNNWFVISGISGCGKTHLCTAIFKELIMNGLSAKYMMWRDELIKLKQLRKSSFIDNITKYEELINELKNVDVLYIDDFLKLYDKNSFNSNDDLNLAYEIINDRYANDKITIISTELNKEEIENIDVATCGRINEKSGKNYIQLLHDKNRNYRMK